MTILSLSVVPEHPTLHGLFCSNAPCDVAVEDRGDGTYAVSYCADEPGDYEIDVLAGGQHIRGAHNMSSSCDVCIVLLVRLFRACPAFSILATPDLSLVTQFACWF